VGSNASTKGALVADAEKFWPFDDLMGQKAKPNLRPAPVQKKQLADTKKVLLATEVFRRKAATECIAAAGLDEQEACEKAASERLFCAMFKRHADQFQDMIGAEAQKKSCFETNIMETSLDAAKDAQELAASKDA